MDTLINQMQRFLRNVEEEKRNQCIHLGTLSNLMNFRQLPQRVFCEQTT